MFIVLRTCVVFMIGACLLIWILGRGFRDCIHRARRKKAAPGGGVEGEG